MRTEQEIVNRIKSTESFFGFNREVLVPYLSFEAAKEFLKPEVSEWASQPLTDEAVRTEMLDYLSFAWGKALDHRGISAGRSIEKLAEWLWLLGDDELVAFAEDGDNYPQYGAPVLMAISKKYNAAVPEDERAQRMANKDRCRPDCDEGCGR